MKSQMADRINQPRHELRRVRLYQESSITTWYSQSAVIRDNQPTVDLSVSLGITVADHSNAPPRNTKEILKIKNLRARAVRVAGVQILIVGLRVPADPENSVNLFPAFGAGNMGCSSRKRSLWRRSDTLLVVVGYDMVHAYLFRCR